MLKTLHIRNFQSHADTYLEFLSGVNIIVGESDSGKSSIIRALRWLVWNRPQGDAFRSWWGGDIVVELETTDGHHITRRKGVKDGDEYILDGVSFKAFRTEVPEEIEKILNIDDINLQRQLDAHFLLSASPGEVAQHFNKVAHLDIIDVATQRINSDIRELNSSISFKQQELTHLKDTLKNWDYLPDLEKEVLELEHLEKQLIAYETKQSQLQNIITELENIETKRRPLIQIMQIEPLLNEIFQDLHVYKQLQAVYEDLQKHLQEISHVEYRMKDLQQLLQAETPLNEVLLEINTLKEKQNQYQILSRLLQDIESVEKSIETSAVNIQQKEKEFHEAMPDICPLCGK